MKTLFTLLYYILSAVLYVLALPLILFIYKKPKYKVSLPARFFLHDNKPLMEHKIWFHVCSLGEAASLAPLVKHFDTLPLAITTITQTGYEQAKKLIYNVRYLPYELFLPFWMKKSKVLVVLEAELWFMLFWVAKARGTKTVLLNARISDRSFHRYEKVRFFYRKLFCYVDKVFCQNELDKERLESLGAQNVEVIGNIKLATIPQVTKTYEKPKDKTLFVAASTHANEEQLILKSYVPSRNRVLAVVPRHPERFAVVDSMLSSYSKEHNLSYHRFSEKTDFTSDIVLVDTMGELINIYALSDVVILGGAFEPIGGHNPIEPAFFKNKIITGTHYHNQKSLMALVNNVVEVQNKALKDVLANIEAVKIASIEGGVDLRPFYNYIESEIQHG